MSPRKPRGGPGTGKGTPEDPTPAASAKTPEPTEPAAAPTPAGANPPAAPKPAAAKAPQTPTTPRARKPAAPRSAMEGPAESAGVPAVVSVATTPEALAHWLREQRWYAASSAAAEDPTGGARTGPGSGPSPAMSAAIARSDDLPDARFDPDHSPAAGLDLVVADPIPLGTDPPVGVLFVDTATGDRYQLLAALSSASDPGPHRASPDVAGEPTVATALVTFVADGGRAAGTAGTVVGHWIEGAARPGTTAARALGTEQSNTSVVVGGTHVLKVLRRVHPGIHPEVEVGRHLAAVAAAPGADPIPVAPLAGWYELAGPGATTTLGVVQELVPGALDGWALTLSALAADPGSLLTRLRDLGLAVAHLHAALARPLLGTGDRTDPADPTDPAAFGAAPLDAAALDAVVAGIVDDATRLFGTGAAPADARAALVGRTDQLRAHAAALRRSVQGDLGPAIRTHGDLHLGQTVVGPHGWVILDFEGEPSRSLADRRQRHSPLRDVAGMLRSFAYAATTHRRAEGHPLPDGWEPAARAAFLDGYLATVDAALLPASAAATHHLLALFELEKVLYEIGYEMAHRPDWLPLPIAGLERLLADGPGTPRGEAAR